MTPTRMKLFATHVVSPSNTCQSMMISIWRDELNKEEARSITEYELTASEIHLRSKCVTMDDLKFGHLSLESTQLLDWLKEIKLQMFLRGYETAVRDFGIYKDGVQKIGCLETPIKEVIERLYK